MKHSIGLEDRRTLDELHRLRCDARALLDAASPAARKEWKNLENRLPSTSEMTHGTIALSTPELNAICSKVRRFRDILAAGPPRARVGAQVAAEGAEAPRRKGG
jgi:hypothetical protein